MQWELPAQDVEYGLAHQLLAQEPLQRRILEALVGQPHRYSELKPLLDGRGDELLTKTLKSMRAKGLLKPGVDLASRQKVYALSNLGRLTVLRMHEMIPHRDSIEAYERGKAAAGVA